MLTHFSSHSPLGDVLRKAVEIDRPSGLRLRIASASDRANIIELINLVAGERKYLQTDRYCPTPAWEQLLVDGININEGLLLILIENKNEIVGFARLSPDLDHPLGRRAGNIGIALLPLYRSRGFGATILNRLIDYAIILNYQILTANILETNIRSQKLFMRRGFSVTNCREMFLQFLDIFVNELCYEVDLSRIGRQKQYELFNQQKADQSPGTTRKDREPACQA